MTYTLYGIPNCDTVKKARTWLDENEIEYQFFNFKKEILTKERVESWFNQVSKEILINKVSSTYKGLNEQEKENLSDDSAAIEIILNNNSIIKRPVFEKDGKVLAVGFKSKSYSDVL